MLCSVVCDCSAAARATVAHAHKSAHVAQSIERAIDPSIHRLAAAGQRCCEPVARYKSSLLSSASALLGSTKSNTRNTLHETRSAVVWCSSHHHSTDCHLNIATCTGTHFLRVARCVARTSASAAKLQPSSRSPAGTGGNLYHCVWIFGSSGA